MQNIICVEGRPQQRGGVLVDSELNKILIAWREQAAKLEAGEITKEDYDRWRYNYPKYDTTQRWAKVPSKELSDALIKGLKKQRKDK